MSKQVDAYFDGLEKWEDELRELRGLLLDCGLEETLKWRSPCYTYNGGNVCIIGGLNDYCVLSFFKGALLADPEGLLKQPGENTRAARIIPISSVSEINSRTAVLKAYVHEAIELERSGNKVDFSVGRTDIALPEELQECFRTDAAFQKAFDTLTPGRQRAYLLHFSGAKQAATRTARIEKYRERILEGRGMNDW